MIYVFLAEGFEEIEAIAPVDILRRCGAKVVTVSITDDREVKGAHGITVLADATASVCNFKDAKAIVLPGGLPGADNLENSEIVKKALISANERGAVLAAICAAPKVLGKHGLLAGKKATCYPGFESELVGAEKASCKTVICENIVTACGAGAAYEFGFAIAEALGLSAEGEKVSQGMLI